MNSSTLTTYFSLLNFALKRQDGLGKLVNGVFFAVVAGGLLLAAFIPDLKDAGFLLSLTATAGILISYWLLICIGLMLQNTPANACTVPFLHSSLKNLSASIACVMSVIFAGFYAFIYGHFMLVFCVSLMSFSMFMSANICLYLLYFAGLVSSGYWLPFFLKSEQSAMVMLLLIIVSFSYVNLGLRLSFRQGGDAHFKSFKTLGHLLRQATPSDQSSKGWEQIEWLFKILSFPYFYELRSATKRGLDFSQNFYGSTRSRRKLVGFGFGPGLHWCYDIFPLVVIGGTLLLGFFSESQKSLPSALIFSILACTSMTGFALAMSCKMSLYQTRKEQALLCLAPTMPSVTAFNSFVIQILWRRFVQSWVISAVAVGLILLIGVSQKLEPLFVWAIGLGLSPLFFVYMLRDYSKLDRSAVNEVSNIGLVVFIIAACYLLNRTTDQDFIFTAIGIVIIAMGIALVGVKRWRTLSTGPALLPVGRRC